MGANWVRNDGGAGSIDLSAFVPEEDQRSFSAVRLVSELGVEYTLSATEETQNHEGIVTPVNLSIIGERWPDDELDTLILLPVLAYNAVRNWTKESRHFPKKGLVSIEAEIVFSGQPITINNSQTKPIVRGWVREMGVWLPNF